MARWLNGRQYSFLTEMAGDVVFSTCIVTSPSQSPAITLKCICHASNYLSLHVYTISHTYILKKIHSFTHIFITITQIYTSVYLINELTCTLHKIPFSCKYTYSGKKIKFMHIDKLTLIWSVDMNLSKLWETMEREAWCPEIFWVTKSQTCFSNWTKTISATHIIMCAFKCTHIENSHM